MKRANIVRCALALRDGKSATIAELATELGLSRPTVESAVGALRNDGLAAAASSNGRERGAGRPAKRFRFRSESAFIAAVDVGRQEMKALVADAGGAIHAFVTREVKELPSRAGRISLVCDLIEEALTHAGIERSGLAGISVAVTGLVGNGGRVLVSRNLPDWEGVDIAAPLHGHFRCEVAVDNDVRLATLAEHQLGAARFSDDVLYFNMGRRISMGVMIDGKIRRGSHSAAGEIGELAFVELVDETGQVHWQNAASAEGVLKLARAADPAASKELGWFITQVAQGIAYMAMAIDPDVIVVGGGLSRAGEFFLDPLKEAVRSAIPLPIHPVILASELGGESIVLGALLNGYNLVMDRLLGAAGLPPPQVDHSLITSRV